MKALHLLFGLLALGALASGCGSTTSQPVAAGNAAPAVSSSSAAADSQKQWDALVAAAKKEGKVVAGGMPATPDTRRDLPAAFTKRFGIAVDYLTSGEITTATVMNQIVTERSAGLHTIDLVIGGAAPLYQIGYPEKLFDPLRPALINPEVTDPSKWVNGGPWFDDPEKQQIVRLSNTVGGFVAVNTQIVKLADLKSWKDLLDPKYKGKIAAVDYAVPTGGSVLAFYLRDTFGVDYLQALYKGQQVVVSRDARQLSDWLARGNYPIVLALAARDIEGLKADGFPVEIGTLPDGPGYLSSSAGVGVLIKDAPHPNAAKLFMNWVLMKEGNEIWNRTQRTASLRTDLDNASWNPPYVIPKPGVHYVDSSSWDETLSKRSTTEYDKLRQALS